MLTIKWKRLSNSGGDSWTNGGSGYNPGGDVVYGGSGYNPGNRSTDLARQTCLKDFVMVTEERDSACQD